MSPSMKNNGRYNILKCLNMAVADLYKWFSNTIGWNVINTKQWSVLFFIALQINRLTRKKSWKKELNVLEFVWMIRIIKNEYKNDIILFYLLIIIWQITERNKTKIPKMGVELKIFPFVCCCAYDTHSSNEQLFNVILSFK